MLSVRFSKHHLVYVKFLVVGLFLVLFAIQADKPYVLDEAGFPFVSYATSDSGKPIYYHGESSPEHVGTYHPTLYINSLALFIKFFGFNEITVRAYGAITVLLSAFMLTLILRQLSTQRNETSELILLALFLLNPYTLANATLPDIDSTILPVVFLLFIYATNRLLLVRQYTIKKVVTILTLVFALALWTKLTTPLILPLYLLCIAYIVSRNIKRTVLITLSVTMLGSFVFASSYYIYCAALDLSPSYTYEFLLSSFAKGTDAESVSLIDSIVRNIGYIRYFFYWPTLPIIVLFLVSLMGVLLNKDYSKIAMTKRVLGLFAICTTVFYSSLISPFGGFFKYPFVVFGIVALVVVLFSQQYIKKGYEVKPLFAFLFVVSGFFIELYFWGDSMFTLNRPFKHTFSLVLVSAIIYVLLRLRPTLLVRSLFILAIFFSIGFQFSISRIHAISPYSTKYLYGQTGLEETANYLKLSTTSDEIIWSMKDVGYLAERRFIESYTYYFNKSLEQDLERLLQEGTVRYYVVSTGIGQDNIDYYVAIREILDDNATVERQFGNHIIYKSKGAL